MSKYEVIVLFVKFFTSVVFSLAPVYEQGRRIKKFWKKKQKVLFFNSITYLFLIQSHTYELLLPILLDFLQLT